jgi:hypothetical protein
MGWTHLIGGETREWEEEVEAGFEEAGSGEDEDEEAGESREGEERRGSNCPVFPFEKHPLYSEALAFTASLDQVFADDPESVREHPAVAELGTQMTLATAKLAAALNDSEIEELGMCIAYLKRALRALTAGLDAAVKLRDQSQIDEQRFDLLRGRIFSIRDGIVTTMGEMRAEFRRRHGSR